MSKDKKKSCGILIRCGKRFLLVHSTTEFTPQLVDDGRWSYPKGQVEEGESDETTALRELKEETGIDLFHKRNELELIVEYESPKRIFTAFLYVDKQQELMNHLFHCESKFTEKGNEKTEIDRFHWFTKKELEEVISESHKGKLFPKRKRKRRMNKILTAIYLGDHFIDDFINDNLLCRDIVAVNKSTNFDDFKHDSVFIIPNPFNFVCDVATKYVIDGNDSEIQNSLDPILHNLDLWIEFVENCDLSKVITYDDFIYSEKYRKKIADILNISDSEFWEYKDVIYNTNILTDDEAFTYLNVIHYGELKNGLKIFFQIH